MGGALVLIAVVDAALRSPKRAARDLGGRGRRVGPRQERVRLQAPGAHPRCRARGRRGLFFAFQFSFFSPGDFDPLLTFFAYTIDSRRDGSELGAPVGAVLFGVIFAGTRFDCSRSPCSTRPTYLRLVVIGLILIALMLFRPQGLFGRREEMVLE